MSTHSEHHEAVVDSDYFISYSPTSLVDEVAQIGANSEERLRAVDAETTAGELVEQEVHVISSDADTTKSMSAMSDLVGFSDDNNSIGQSKSSTPVGGRKRSSSEALNVEAKKTKSCGDGLILATVPDAPISNLSVHASNRVVPEAPTLDQGLHTAQITDLTVPVTPIPNLVATEVPVQDVAVSETPISNVFTLPNIVEVGSTSTSNTLREKRNARNIKLQTMTQQRNPHVKHLASRSETSSDLPNSSQSNNGAPNKYGIRPTLLKGTAPGDSLERQLALLTNVNPQMTLDDKMYSWECSSELSDVEDVNEFDDLFRQQEEANRKAKNDPNLSVLATVPTEKSIDFNSFCKRLKNTPIQTLPPIERPTTSAAARAAMGKYSSRLVPATMNKSELSPKKQSQNSTSPPATSSSENPINRYINLKKRLCAQKALQKMQTNETGTQQSSSEETSTDDNDIRRHHMALTDKRNSFAKRAGAASVQRVAGPSAIRSQSSARAPLYEPEVDIAQSQMEVHKAVIEHHNITSGPQHSPDEPSSEPQYLIPVTAKRSEMTLTPYSSLHSIINRLPPSSLQINNSTANKFSIFSSIHSYRNKNNEDPKCLIQARLDSTSWQKQQQLKEKKSELFKTPTVPQKYRQTTNGNVDNLEEAVHTQSDYSTSETTSVSDAGGFHQQHEFCNYLGLTNMSTANAVANAVAELSKCNLKRRSLRVHHQRQQVKLDKSAKTATDVQPQATKEPTDQKIVHQPKTIKETQLQVLNTRLAGGSNPVEKITETPPDVANENSRHLNISPVRGMRKKSWELSGVLKSPTPDSTPQSENIEKKAGIKIVCQISAVPREIAEQISKDYVRKISHDIAEPIAQKLLNKYETSNGAVEAEDNGEKAEMELELSRRVPIHSAAREEYCGPSSTTQSKKNRSLSHRSIKSDEKGSKKTPEKEKTLEKDNENPEALRERQRKFQQYLKESREHKPSIFIVKTMHSQEEQDKPLPATNNAVMAPLPQVSPKKEVTIKASDKQSAPAKIGGKNLVSPTSRNNSGTIRTTRLTTVPPKLSLNLSNTGLAMSHRRPPKKALPNGTAKDRKPQTLLPLLTRSKLNHIQKEKTRLAKMVVYKQHVHSKRKSKTVLQKLPSRRNPPKHKLDNSPTVASTKQESFDLDTVKQNETISNTNESQNRVESAHDSSNSKRLKGRSNELISDANIDSTVGDAKVQLVKIATKDASTQCEIRTPIRYLSQAQNFSWKLPLKRVHGSIVYIFYELDVLIVVQEQWISFWKYSKLINILAATRDLKRTGKTNVSDAELSAPMEWILLGECKRMVHDIEVSCPYNNRMCHNNSMPVYLEMRCVAVPRGIRRDCNLLQLYMNVYYYNEEDMQVKAHSVHLDAVQTIPDNVTYTTLPESRYFVMSWPQENVVGKVCNGMCKYSLTPSLDTLASIREFKNLRHEIRFLDCIQDDKLVGFGKTQITIWDHRSGDVIMNYDLEAPLGRSLGNIYFPSVDLGQNNMVVLFQYRCNDQNAPELMVIACSISCSSPSYRVLQLLPLPTPSFNFIANSINTSEHLIITAQNDEELWISCASPNMITSVPAYKSRRFYARGRTQVLEISKEDHNEEVDTYHLAVDSISNYLLKLATREPPSCQV